MLFRSFPLLALICCCASLASAQIALANRTLAPVLVQDNNELSVDLIVNDHPALKCVQRNNEQSSDPLDITVTTSRAGELSEILSENLLQIGDLHVEGPINDDDFNTLWVAAFDGQLKILDLGKATVEEGRIPDYALFHKDVQVDWDAGIIYTIGLQKLILPCNTLDIGRHAFAYATRLTEIVFPDSLKAIGIASFTNCTRFAPDTFILPPNLEVLGYQAFYECFSLGGEVVLPSSLRIIDGAAFYHIPITKINIPESVEYLGDFAFYGTQLKEIDLPDNCDIERLGAQFYGCFELERVHFPSTCTYFPDDIFSGCIALKEINLPSEITYIGMNAFDCCSSLEAFSTLVLPEGLLSIGRQSFSDVPIKELHLPASLNYLGSEAFYYCNKIERIYSRAPQAPECEVWNLNPDRGPFYGIPTDIEIFIPMESKIDYSSAFGWSQFTNFIETEDFPYAAVESISIDNQLVDNNIYDIYGRQVQNPIHGSIYIQAGKKVIYRR